MDDPSLLTKNGYLKHIIEDVGNGFGIGCLGGGIIYFVQGMINAPRGQRLFGGACALRDRAPIYGGSIALWCGTFSLVSGALAYYRQKQDHWNPAVGGAATAFVLSVRGGGLSFGLSQALQVGTLFYFLFKGIDTMNRKALEIIQKQDEKSKIANKIEIDPRIFEIKKQLSVNPLFNQFQSNQQRADPGQYYDQEEVFRKRREQHERIKEYLATKDNPK